MFDEFQDYYELLEVSPNASLETIDRVFRYLATKWHPDAGGEKEKFALLVVAFETLRDPAARAKYDVEYRKHERHLSKLEEGTDAVRVDSVNRRELLSVFYSKRRQDSKNPGLGITTVERLMKCPGELLEFHLWYFREKGLIKREENGGFSITADGVDYIESTQGINADEHRRLEDHSAVHSATGSSNLAGTPSYN